MIGTPATAKTLQQVLADGPADLRVTAAHAALVSAAQLAKDGHTAAARSLLESVVRAAPPGHVASAAQTQAAALRTGSASR
jgi:hypothetical protein